MEKKPSKTNPEKRVIIPEELFYELLRRLERWGQLRLHKELLDKAKELPLC